MISLDDISEYEPLAQDSISNRTQRASTDPPNAVQRAFSCGVSNEDRSGGVRKPNLRRVQSDCHVRPKSHVRRFTGGCQIEEERYQDDRIETTFQVSHVGNATVVMDRWILVCRYTHHSNLFVY